MMTRLASLTLLAALLLASTSATQITLLGRSDSDYTPLTRTLRREFGVVDFAVRVNGDLMGSDFAVHLPGGDYSFLASSPVPVLAIAAELDGVTRFSLFAAQRHQHAHQHRFVVVGGASHHSFAQTSWKGLDLDLQAEITNKAAQQHAATLIHEWVRTNQGNSTTSTKLLEAAELRAAQLAAPIVKALQLEGSAALGQEICNSDFPTNPSCNYPKYPDFSLPPGPSPAPSPLPSSDCVCGSEWVTNYAFPAVSGAADKGFAVHAADAFHDVSDVHPFHLPHTWNNCTAPQGCNLNVTTLTMNVNGSGTLFPSSAAPPLSALELRTKMKSRQTLWEDAGLGKQSVDVDQKNMSLCRSANRMAWDWALANADPAVRSRFQKSGEPFVMVDDVVAPIGWTGPTWIKKELNYTRTAQGTIEVQSWTFVVGESPIKSKLLPTGMHYCKLLSPARCMEWIYTDGLRTKMGAGSKAE
jgi:hypothetical protein